MRALRAGRRDQDTGQDADGRARLVGSDLATGGDAGPSKKPFRLRGTHIELSRPRGAATRGSTSVERDREAAPRVTRSTNMSLLWAQVGKPQRGFTPASSSLLACSARPRLSALTCAIARRAMILKREISCRSREFNTHVRYNT